jgi:2-keto-4-pentenoate hydratase/2-oxohepta-3-ene-1,7-dioic acid hydratase in catechol pathway
LIASPIKRPRDSKLYYRDHIRITSLLVYRIVAESRSIIPEVDVKFLPPVMHMDKLACVGLNYSGHCQEQGIPIPESPIIFSKFPSNIIGPRDNILLPPISDVSRR